jgi:hypothetical protein
MNKLVTGAILVVSIAKMRYTLRDFDDKKSAAAIFVN